MDTKHPGYQIKGEKLIQLKSVRIGILFPLSLKIVKSRKHSETCAVETSKRYTLPCIMQKAVLDKRVPGASSIYALLEVKDFLLTKGSVFSQTRDALGIQHLL